MKFFDAGAEAEGFIAIGQFATGVIAIGQMATGIVAIGQLARGAIVVGQLAIGVVTFGQAFVSLTYGGGMVGLAGVRMRQSLLVYGLVGNGDLFPPRSTGSPRRLPTFEPRRTASAITALRVGLLAVVAAAVVYVGFGWLPSFDAQPDEPLPPAHAPGTR